MDQMTERWELGNEVLRGTVPRLDNAYAFECFNTNYSERGYFLLIMTLGSQLITTWTYNRN